MHIPIIIITTDACYYYYLEIIIDTDTLAYDRRCTKTQFSQGLTHLVLRLGTTLLLCGIPQRMARFPHCQKRTTRQHHLFLHELQTQYER